MKYRNILWLFSTLCVAALAMGDSSDIYQGCIWVEPGINALYSISDAFLHGIKVQWPGTALFIQFDISEVDIKSSAWSFEVIIIDEYPPQPRRITDIAIVDIDLDIVGKNYDGDKRPRIWLNPKIDTKTRSHKP